MLALYPQTTCFYRALIHTPPQRVRQAPWERLPMTPAPGWTERSWHHHPTPFCSLSSTASLSERGWSCELPSLLLTICPVTPLQP